MSSDKKAKILAKTNGKCWYCGCALVEEDFHKSGIRHHQAYVADHAVPKAQGGGNALDNLLPSCWSCNCRKRGLTVEQYRDHIFWVDVCHITPFTEQQREFLKNSGFELPENTVVFWGERE